MTGYRHGDVVLVDFGFSEGIGSKKRPVLVVSSESYHRGRQEVIAAAITSNVRRILFGDTRIDRWKESGLLYPSVVTGVLRTIKGSLLLRKLGALSKEDLHGVKRNLNRALGF